MNRLRVNVNKSVSTDTPEQVDKTPGKVSRSIADVIGGSVLTRDYVVRQLPFLIYLTFLAIIYISNNYACQRIAMAIEEVKNGNKILRYEQVSVKSQLMYLSRQSEVVERLEGTGLREAIHPPVKLFNRKSE